MPGQGLTGLEEELFGPLGELDEIADPAGLSADSDDVAP